MASIRDFQAYVKAEIASAIKAPLYRAKEIVFGEVKTVSEYQLDVPKNSIIEVRYDDRLHLIPYNRRDFMTWFEGCLIPGVYVPVPKGATRTLELLDAINNQWGFDFTEQDIVDTDITYRDVNGVKRAIVPFAPSNVWFIGQIELPLWPTEVIDGKVAFVTDWEPRPLFLNNTAGNPNRKTICASVLTHNFDYSIHSVTLAAVPTVNLTPTALSTTNGQAIASLLASVDKRPWTYNATNVNDGSAEFNLAGAFCLYNGPTEGFEGLPPIFYGDLRYLNNSYHELDTYVNKDMKNVMMLMLNSNNFSRNVNGVMFIHYGGPTNVIAPVAYKPPLHYWPLNGDLLNAMGGPSFATAPSSWRVYPDIGKVAITPNSSGNAIGVPLPTAQDFTFQITFYSDYGNVRASLINGHISSATAGMLENPNGYPNLRSCTHLWAAALNASELINTLEAAVITVVRKDNTYRIYNTGELIAYGEIPAGVALLPYTHVYGVLAISDLYYYDYAMSADLVKKLARGDYGSRK